MSFTAGAILSSYAFGALGSAAKGLNALGKVSKAAEIGEEVSNLSKVANALKASSSTLTGAEVAGDVINKANKLNQFLTGTGKFAKIGTNLMIGSGYEAGTESSDFIQQATAKHTQDYINKNGEPTTPEQKQAYQEDITKFNNDILPTANAIFAGNLVLVGASHLATLPTVFGAGLKNTIVEAVESNVLKAGTKAGERAILESAEKKGIGKILGTAVKLMTPAYAEGVQEEGGQNLMKNLGLDYVSKAYNPDSAKRTYDLANSFGNSLEQAYATKDGWKEILSGMIIGSLGAPNLSKIGRMSQNEDGTKSFKPSLLNPEKAW